MNNFACPYCGHPKQEKPEGAYYGCRYCGYKSALVDIDGQKMLIVDHKIPFLNRRCHELSEQMPEVKVVVDRRVVQDQIEAERREDGPAGLA